MKIRIAEVFESISGEVGGFPQGSPCTFVRLAGCSLRCPFCFGVKPGRRIPKISLASEPNKHLPDVKVGDVLMTFDNDKKLVETQVTRVIVREVDTWYELVINNKLYFVTEDHPFFTTRGLLRTDELLLGDMIWHSSPKDKISFSKLNDKNPMRRILTPDRRAKIDELKNITPEQRKENARRLISISKLGNKNPNWKGGKYKNFEELKSKVRSGTIDRCQICGIKPEPSSITRGKGRANLDVHHKDHNRENDDPINLVVVCESCHYSEHEMGYNFWNGSRSDGKQLIAKNGFEVQKIRRINRFDKPFSTRPAPLKVYNLSCSPYNSYLVDYMWVHNCDTPQYQDPKSGKDWWVEDIAAEIMAFSWKQILITGGEPMEQPEAVQALVNKIKGSGNEYKIQVETNGSIPLDRIALVDYWVVDHKGKDAMQGVPYRWNPNILQRNMWIKCLVGSLEDLDHAIGMVSALEFDTSERNLPKFAISPLAGTGGNQEVVSAILRSGLPIQLNVQIHKQVGVR